MKFVIAFKTPDVLDYCLKNYNSQPCEAHWESKSKDCMACVLLQEQAAETIATVKDCAERYIQYGECITIEFDTDTQTATVIPVRKRS
jgi:hypothetical protein